MRKFKFNGEVEVTDKISGGGVRDLINTIYPVGISLEFKLNVNPNTEWPWQTWVEWGQGRVVVGAGTYTEGTATKTYSLGDSGGSKNAVVVRHQHQLNNNATGNRVGVGYGNPGFDRIGNVTFNTDIGEEFVTRVEGVDGADKNLQPYIVGKRWTRTA